MLKGKKLLLRGANSSLLEADFLVVQTGLGLCYSDMVPGRFLYATV